MHLTVMKYALSIESAYIVYLVRINDFLPWQMKYTILELIFFPFIEGISRPKYCSLDNIIEYNNRPFIDDRTDEEKENYSSSQNKGYLKNVMLLTILNTAKYVISYLYCNQKVLSHIKKWNIIIQKTFKTHANSRRSWNWYRALNTKSPRSCNSQSFSHRFSPPERVQLIYLSHQ